ncbi:unnamed protein product [Prunus armeniaca]|nr:hypothetical protein GBA52_008404 [Prunus armeniaca]
MKKNVGLLSLVNKLAKDKRGLGVELAKSHKDLEEANKKIEDFASELRFCYDDAVKDYTKSAEYQEKLASHRVEGYFDLIEKVGEKYPSLKWSFLGDDAEDIHAEQDGGPDAEPVGQIAQNEDPSTREATTREGDPTGQGGEPTIQGAEPTDEVVVITVDEIRGKEA